MENFFYNPISGRCDRFMFSGCGGNENRFRTEESCTTHCVCHIPPEAGPCRSSIEKWFYNPTTGCCEQFTYGGCQGNGNNFQTYEECRASCVGSAPGMVKPRGSNWGSGSVIQFETNNFYNPNRYGNKFAGSKSVWLHGDRMSVMGGTPQASKIIRYITPEITKKDHWHFVANQGTKDFPQQLGGRFEISGVSSSSQMQPVGGSRMVLSGSSSVPVGTSGGQFSSVIGSSGGSGLSGSIPMGGSRISMSGSRSIPVGGSASGTFSRLGTSSGSLSGFGGQPMGGGKLVLSGSRTGPTGAGGQMSSMFGTSGGQTSGGLGGSSLRLSGQSTGGMTNDDGGSFISAQSGAQHPMQSGFGGGMTNALSRGQGGQTGGRFMSRSNLLSEDNMSPGANSGRLSLTFPVEPSGGLSNALLGGGGGRQDIIGGGLNGGGGNFMSAKSNAWHPAALKRK